LKGELRSGKKGIFMRRALIVFQFTITISLVVAVLIVFAQIDFHRSLDLGYNRENVVAIPNSSNQGEDLLKKRLSEVPGFSGLGRMSFLPGLLYRRIRIIPEGSSAEDNYTAADIPVDEGVVETLMITMAEGRNFLNDSKSDFEDKVLVNETLVRTAGWEKPIGKRLEIETASSSEFVTKRVIGVIKDFHFFQAKQAIEPMVFVPNKRRSGFLIARISNSGMKEGIDKIEKTYKEIFPNRQFRYTVLDDLFENQFNGDRNFAANIGIFGGIAIYIACLGLIGLVSSSTESRRKEIAVRKILGCRTSKIVKILASDLLKWVMLANLFAWPIGYFAMSFWLEDFAYKMPFSLSPFIISGFGSFVIAFLTIFYQTYNAASSNPVDSLKYE
ncbi:ABC transporter permease, partial [candidate division KSB1 bacterium]